MKKLNIKNFNSTVDLYKSNKLNKAEIQVKKIIIDTPNEAITYNLLGAIFIAQKKFTKAILEFKKAIKLKPDYAEAYNNLGNALREEKDYKESLRVFKKAIEIKPEFAEAYNNMGILLKEQKLFEEAINLYKKAITIQPNLSDSYNNIGNILKDQLKFNEAIKYFNKAIEINKNFAEAYNNLALTFQKQNKYKEAEKYFNTSIKIDPASHEPRYNLGYLQLSQEFFLKGWKNHEFRKAKKLLAQRYNLANEKMWDGKKFSGKLLVFGEQGLCDQVLFSTMLKDLLKIHKDITVTIEKRLLSIFNNSFKKIKFISDESKIDLKKFDKYIFLGSLGKFFRNSSKEFPKKTKPFLFPNIKKANKDFDFINNNKHKKIGISWQTNSINNRKGRNIPLIFLKKILKINKCKFINLQYGDTSLEREKIKNTLGVNIFHVESLDYKNDIENLSKLISKCDLVITIPNFTTQLAAAIGVPVYLLLPYSSDWRWFLKRTDSLWYNNIRLFRQKKLGNWNDVIDEVYDSLKINK